jgi:hypothetical protein
MSVIKAKYEKFQGITNYYRKQQINVWLQKIKWGLNLGKI